MSDFIQRLVQRGAGVESTSAARSPSTQRLSPDLNITPTNIPGVETTPDPIMPQAFNPQGISPAQSQQGIDSPSIFLESSHIKIPHEKSWEPARSSFSHPPIDGEISKAQQSASIQPAKPLQPIGPAPPDNLSLEKISKTGLSPKLQAESPDTGLGGKPQAPGSLKRQEEKGPAISPGTGIKSRIQKREGPKTMATVQPEAPAYGAIPDIDYPSTLPSQTYKEPISGFRISNDTSAALNNDAAKSQRPPRIEPITQTKKTPEPEGMPSFSEEVTTIEPEIPHTITQIRPKIRPVPEQPLRFPEKAGPAGSSSKPRSVQVRIGTIEVRTTTPLGPKTAPATRTQGFDNYAQARNYINWKP